jgi:hypothetical protein
MVAIQAGHALGHAAEGGAAELLSGRRIGVSSRTTAGRPAAIAQGAGGADGS